jgi:Uma2 family endonuclease
MLEAWGDADVMTVSRELNVPEELIEVLERLDMRYEVIDGDLVVNASPTFAHEDFGGNLFVQLHAAAPPELAVLGDFGFFYDALVDGNIRNHTRADITVVRRADVEKQGTVHPPLLIVEVQSLSTKARDVRIKRDIYERSGVCSYLLLHPVLKVLTVLELEDGVYVEKHRAEPPAFVHLTRPFPVTIDLGRVFRD